MRWSGFGLVLGLSIAAGCGGPGAATVSGEVKVDGEPLQKGVISFSPLEGAGAVASGQIENGRYSVQTTPGKKRVQISAPIVTGQRREYNSPNAPMVEITEEGLADKYHTKSELTFDVQAGNNTRDWTVEKKPQGRSAGK
jgi:hypothetical protein